MHLPGWYLGISGFFPPCFSRASQDLRFTLIGFSLEQQIMVLQFTMPSNFRQPAVGEQRAPNVDDHVEVFGKHHVLAKRLGFREDRVSHGPVQQQPFAQQTLFR